MIKKYLPILIILAGFYLFASPTKAFAATLCWAGSAGGNWSVAGNWITTAGVVSGAAPGSSDTATFDPSKTICTGGTPTNTNSTVDASFAGTVGGVNIVSGYTQTITQSHALAISGTAGYVQAAGTWDASGGSNAFSISSAAAGPFTLSGGTFKASTGTFTYSPNSSSSWNTTGGTFTAGSGTVDFNSGAGPTYTLTGSMTFNNLKFTGNNNSAFNTIISSGTTLTVNGTLSAFTDTVPIAGISVSGPGGITANGNIAISGQGMGGTVVITIAGTGSQTFSGDGTASTNRVPGITINKSSGTLTLQNTIAPYSDWTYLAGTVVTTGNTVRFFRDDNSVAVNISGSMTFNNLTFYGENNNGMTANIASGTNLTVSGTLTFDSDSIPTPNVNGPGTITALGNITTGHNGAAGSVPIILTGSGNQTVTASGTNFPTGTVTFNKSGGTINLANNWTLGTSGQDLLVQSGSSQTITGAFTLQVDDQITISGTLIQGTSTLSSTNGGFTVSSGGSWTNTSTGDIIDGPNGITNNGILTLDGTQSGCGDADTISITSSSGAQRAWTGSGSFTLYDITMNSQTTSLGLNAYSSTDGGNNSGFTFLSSCPVNSSTAYWKFDEGQGVITHDSSTNTSSPATGTLSGATLPTWQTEDLCISGKCLYFDGVSSSVNTSGGAGNIQSVAMWVKPNNFTVTQALIDLDGGSHTITIASNPGQNTAQITANNFSSATYYVNGISGNRTLTANVWNYVEVTTATPIMTGTVTIAKSSSTFFQGFIDEAKLYNTQRSAQQVKSDYAGRGAPLGANDQVSNQINNNPAALSNGLVGYYKMDEKTWSASASTPAIVQPNAGNCTCDTTTVGPTGHTTPVTVNYTVAQTAGDLNVVIIGWSNATGSVTSVVDSASGRSYSVATALSQGGGVSQVIYYLNNISAATAGSNTVTVTLAADQDFVDVRILEYSGVATSSPVDGSGSSATGTGTAADSGSFSTTNANDLIVGSGTTSSSFTSAGAGFTSRGITAFGDITEDKNVSSTGSYNATATQNSGNWVMQVAAFKAFSTSNTGIVLDSSGNANNGTPGGSAAPAAGKFGNGGSFNGTTDYVNDGNGASLQVTGPLTLSAWVKGVAAGSTRDIIAKNGNSSNLGYKLYLDSTSKLNMDVSSNGTSVTTATGTTALTSTSTWYHITGVYIPNVSITVFVNGLQEGQTISSIPTSINNPSTNLIIAAENGGASNFYSGTIDEARIYNRALSPVDVYNLYNFAPGPVGRWELDEGTGTSAIDSSGFGNTGTITAGTGGYVTGKYGKAYNFDKATTKIDAGSGTTLTDLKGTAGLSAEAWIYPKSTGEGGAAGGVIIGKATGPTGTLANGWEFFVTTSNALKFTSDGSTTDLVRLTSTTLTLNTWSHVAVNWDGSTTAANVHIYINGAEVAYSTTTNGSGLTSDSGKSLIIGNDSTQADTFDGYIDHVQVYNYPRIQKQVIEDLNAGHPAPGSPVGTPYGYWKFNEGAANTCSGGTNDACNSGNGGSALDGAFSATTPTYTLAGKFDKALTFNGTSSFVNVTNSTNFDANGSYMTLTAWINPASLASNIAVFGKGGNAGTSNGWNVLVLTTGILRVTYKNGGGDTCLRNSVSTIPTSTWTHIAVAFKVDTTSATCNGTTNDIQIYINGILNQGAMSNAGASAPAISTAKFKIGARGEDAAEVSFFNGSIDEPKVYLEALTPDQVKIDMNNGQVQQLGAAGNNSTYQTGAANQEYCVPGDTTSCAAPVGRWDFEEGIGSTVNDISGNGNNGTITGATYSTGKVGKALNFNGGTDAVSVSNSISTKTVEFWVNPSTTTQNLIDLRTAATAASISVSAGTISATGFTSPTIYVNGLVSSTLVANTWQHVTVTTGTAITANAIRFGVISSTSLTGKLDQIKFFDYARTPAQIAYDYNRGGPVAWYKFDECTGSTIHDSSGNGYNGTQSGTTTGTCTTASTFWGGASGNSTTNSGKINYAGTFNGTSDTISLPTSVSIKGDTAISWAGWVKINSFSGTPEFYSESTNDSGSASRLEIGGTNGGFNDANGAACPAGVIYGAYRSNTSTPESVQTFEVACGKTVLNTATWYHVAVVINLVTHFTQIYINGRLDSSTSIPDSTTAFNSGAPATNPHIGSEYNGVQFTPGQLDDIRLFNYALTPSQLQQVFNNGAVNFAPTTGAP